MISLEKSKSMFVRNSDSTGSEVSFKEFPRAKRVLSMKHESVKRKVAGMGQEIAKAITALEEKEARESGQRKANMAQQRGRLSSLKVAGRQRQKEGKAQRKVGEQQVAAANGVQAGAIAAIALPVGHGAEPVQHPLPLHQRQVLQPHGRQLPLCAQRQRPACVRM